MSQEVQSKPREAKFGWHTLGSLVLEAGHLATRPVVGGYNFGSSTFEAIGSNQLLRNIGMVAEGVAGLRYGAHPLEFQGKPARIELISQKPTKN